MMKYKGTVDEDYIEVFVLQTIDKGKRVEISRDSTSKAGFWVNINELIEVL